MFCFFFFAFCSGLHFQVLTAFKSYFHHCSKDHFELILYSGRNNTTGNNVFISWCWKQGSSRAGLGPEYQSTGQGVPCYSANSIFRGQTSHRRVVICGGSRTSLCIRNLFIFGYVVFNENMLINSPHKVIFLHRIKWRIDEGNFAFYFFLT